MVWLRQHFSEELASPAQLAALATLVGHLCRGETVPEAMPQADLPDSLLRRHLLAPLAYRAGLPRYRDDFIASSLMAELRQATLTPVLTALAERNIPVILLKGIAYLGRLYFEPAERPMSDIDLLVPPERHGEAALTLRRLGYWMTGSNSQRSPFHHAIGFKRKNAAIDLHRSIMQPWRARIDVPGLWRRARVVPNRPGGVMALDPIDEAVIHLAHMARHELRVPLINYIDAVRLLKDAGTGQHHTRRDVVDRAGEFRLGRAITEALAMTDALAAGRSLERSVLPSTNEILSHQRVPRSLQLAQKALLVEGPLELVGLVLIAGYGRIIHRFRP